MNQLNLFKRITTFVFDVDGVMTDGSLQLLENGELSRRMNARDGYALRHAVQQGYRMAIITGGNSENVKRRLQGLGIQEVYLSVIDKKEKMEDFLLFNDLNKNHVLYMGDDMPDYEALEMVGLPCCPADAAEEIKTISKYISPFYGGAGCVRDVVEKVLKLNDDW
ncbi:MAG TPA: HAD-IA family hydrolase [Chitinophagaceae bacterium]|nr:HAD-IA family hydrolase [Chitinophagaceae bacterium]